MGCHTKAEESSPSDYLTIARGRIVGYIIFKRTFALCEMQTVLSRIWTRIVVSTFYDNNRYMMSASIYTKSVIYISLDLAPLFFCCLYIYCYLQTDYFVVSKLFSGARHVEILRAGIETRLIFCLSDILPLRNRHSQYAKEFFCVYILRYIHYRLLDRNQMINSKKKKKKKKGHSNFGRKKTE